MRIKKTKDLEQLAELYKIDSDKLSKIIIERGIKANIFSDHKDYFGMTIKEACTFANRTVCAFMIYAFPKGVGARVIPLMKDLVLIGEGDCPECGYNLVREKIIIKGREYTEVSCPCCGYENPNNPNWDGMKGGVDCE